MDYSLFIARKLTLSTDGRKSSPAIKVSVTAVALSVAVMIASVAVVLGFKREIRDKIFGFNSHISVYNMAGMEEDNLLTLTPSLREVLDDVPYIEDYSLEASIPAILKTANDFKGIYLRSANGKSISDFLKENLEEGIVPDFSDEKNQQKVVVSRIAANRLGLKTGDRIDTYFISDDVRVRRLEIAGIYNSHFDSYDDVMAYGSLPFIQSIVGLPASQGTSIQVRTDDFNRIGEYTADLDYRLKQAVANGRLYKLYRLDNALSQGAGYFSWLALLDTNVIVILTLMAVVAIATLISGMLILILDKKRFIGVVRALGASIRGVRKVFIYLALRVALIGIAIGNVLAVAILWCQNRWHFLHLDPEAYYIDFVPVQLDLWWIILLDICCFAVIYASLVLPSRFVAGISPTSAMLTE